MSETTKESNGCFVFIIYLIASSAFGCAFCALAKINRLEKRIQALEAKP